MNSIPLFIARRLDLRNKDGRNSTGIVVAIVGISLALVIMMLSIAVMNGFRNEIKRKVTGFETPVTIQLPPPPSDISTDGGVSSLTSQPITLSPALSEAINDVAADFPAMTASLASVRPMILKTDSAFVGVVARGSAAPLSFIEENIVEGQMPDFSADDNINNLVLSSTIAGRLGIQPGERIMAYFFNEGAVKVRKLTVAGVYNTHFVDYDSRSVFTSLDLLRGVDGLNPDQATRIELSGLSDEEIDPATAALQTRLLQNLYSQTDTIIYQVDNVHRRGALYFNWLALLDTNVTVILALMGIVAAFTLISCLFIIILERVNMIGLLKSLGASNSFVRRIFILTAQRIMIRGILWGNAISLILIALQYYFKPIGLDPETYYLSYVPVDITLGDILWLNLGVIVVSVAVLILPSQLVAKISPAKSMRFE